MRLPFVPVPVLLGVLVGGCGSASLIQPDASAGSVSYDVVDAADASCTLNLHAILREVGSTVTVGQVQFRVDPPESGSGDAIVQYQGVVGPTSGLDFGQLQSIGIELIDDLGQSTWTDFDKHDAGTTALAALQFGHIASMSQATALALVNNASSFKAVVNVVASSGGKEAEGTVAPTRDVPESVRDIQRVCFGG